MDYPKSVPSVGLVNGKFVDENSTTGQIGSLIPSAWGNAVTDELLNVIRAGGDEPVEAEHDQLLAAIKVIVRDSIPPEQIRTTLAQYGITDAYTKSVTYTKAEIEALLKNMSALPVGAMVPFPKGTVPAGFLEVDGSVQSIAALPDLAAYLGTTFNKGDEGAGNFRLPESRGEFLRGWDHGRGVDAGRPIASYQLDAIQNITGETSTFPTGNTAPLNSSGALRTNSRNGAPSGIAGGGAWGTASVDFDASRVARTGAETRPRNLSVMWCIKAWNAPVNQGNIDVAELAKEVEKLKSATPIGAIIAFPKGVVPPGYLELDGSVQSIATLPDLAAYLGTTFNKGDEGAGNFRLPESRGEFLRGWDHGRGVDAARVLGSWQKGSLQAFDPTVSATYTGGLGHSAPDTGLLEEFGLDPLVAANYPRSGVWFAQASTTGALADSAGQTRPRNLAVMWCIKAWNAPVNQGNIDIAALAPLVVQATEANQGTAKVASDAQMLDDANDLVMLTPKKARKGFAISLAENGYIAFPTWLGGAIFQWGVIAAVVADTIVPLSFPLAFPGACLGGVSVGNRVAPVSGGTSSWYFASPSKTGASLVHDGSNGGTMGAYWFSWGN